MNAPLPRITLSQSYAWVLREAFIAALSPLFPQFTILRNNAEPIQKPQLPILGVYFVNERMTPDGDWDAGEIRFIHEFTMAFSVMIANNDRDALEQTLDAAFWTIMYGTWSNDGLTNMLTPTTPDRVRFEGVMLGMRRFQFGAVGQNNETPVGELQYDATIKYRTWWAPTVADDLLTMMVTVAPDNVDPTQVQTITVEYDFPSTG